MTTSTPVREEAGGRAATAGQRYGFSGRLARASARRPWLTIGLWILLIFGAVVAGSSLDQALTQDAELLVETESDRAEQLLEEAFAGDAAGQPAEYVVVEGNGTTVDDEAFADVLARLTTDLSSLDGVTAVVGPDSGGPEMVSRDGTIALLQVALDSNDQGHNGHAAALVEAVQRVDAGTPFTITAFGEGSVSAEFDELAESTLRTGEAVAMPIALLILILVFGAVVAALVPVLFAVMAIVLALGMTALVGQVTDLSFFVVQMITMIGLAVGIDYTLFIIQRYREERVAGRERLDAIAVAGGTATRAVVFSGITVVIALLGMLLMPDTLMRSLGIGAILVVLASLALSMTLLPAVLGLLGDRVDKLRLPFSSPGRSAEHRLWARVARRVTRRPAVSVAVAGGLLLLAATPYLGIQVGNNFISALPEDSPSRHAFEVMSTDFSTGGVQTDIAIIADDPSDPAVTAAVDRLVAELESDPVYGNVVATREPDGSLLSVEATTLVDPSSNEGLRAIEQLRDETIPVAFDGIAADALVTGPAASTVDYNDVVNKQLPYMFAFVLGLSFILLLVAFRSIVVPLKAIVMNLLSVGAAYGLIVAVFQHGWAAGLLGFQQVDVIETWIPVMLFAILFGLSMDYHVFLLSRIKERYDITGDNSSSVTFGLGATGAIITGAALIMVAVFAGFAIGDLVPMQQLGFGLGIAVILDATIVRGVLVPATMVLLGVRNWYFPRWLEWLPKISVEGDLDPIDEEFMDLDDRLQPARV